MLLVICCSVVGRCNTRAHARVKVLVFGGLEQLMASTPPKTLWGAPAGGVDGGVDRERRKSCVYAGVRERPTPPCPPTSDDRFGGDKSISTPPNGVCKCGGLEGL